MTSELISTTNQSDHVRSFTASACNNGVVLPWSVSCPELANCSSYVAGEGCCLHAATSMNPMTMRMTSSAECPPPAKSHIIEGENKASSHDCSSTFARNDIVSMQPSSSEDDCEKARSFKTLSATDAGSIPTVHGGVVANCSILQLQDSRPAPQASGTTSISEGRKVTSWLSAEKAESGSNVAAAAGNGNLHCTDGAFSVDFTQMWAPQTIRAETRLSETDTEKVSSLSFVRKSKRATTSILTNATSGLALHGDSTEMTAKDKVSEVASSDETFSVLRTVTPKPAVVNRDDIQTGDYFGNSQENKLNVAEVSSSGEKKAIGKPAVSYIELIAKAILSVPDRRMMLHDIYNHIMAHHPFYNNDLKAWRNSVRHNLSLNECFIKHTRSTNGKGHFWCIHPNCLADFQRGDFRRRHARQQAKSRPMCLNPPIPHHSPYPARLPSDKALNTYTPLSYGTNFHGIGWLVEQSNSYVDPALTSHSAVTEDRQFMG